MNNDHVTGFVTGVACSALAFYWYTQNRERIDEFLKAQELGLTSPMTSFGTPPSRPPVASNGEVAPQPNLAQLMADRERLDDLIAELQANQKPES